MRLQKLLLLVLPGILATALNAQIFLNDVPDSDLGRPPIPPAISFLGIGLAGKLVTDRSLRPAGPVSEVTVDERRVDMTGAIVPGEPLSSVKIQYDEQGRPIQEVSTQNGFVTTTVTKYQNSRMMSQEYSYVVQGKPEKAWTYWIYDSSGKLVEFRRGRGDALENHYTSFVRDNQSRLTSFEYHQGPGDQLQSRTTLAWSPDGRTALTSEYDAKDTLLNTLSETLNAGGKVIRAVIDEMDFQTKKLKRELKVAFDYDQQGRLIQQLTDDYEPQSSGAEFELPPGKVSLVYDDAQHSRTISYIAQEGSLSSTIVSDSSGATIAQTLEEGAGGKVIMNLECTNDDHGNWTNCERVVQAGGNRKLTGVWQRSIMYRR